MIHLLRQLFDLILRLDEDGVAFWCLFGHDSRGDFSGGEFAVEQLNHAEGLWLNHHRLLDQHRGVAECHELLSLLLNRHWLYGPSVGGDHVGEDCFWFFRHDSASVANEGRSISSSSTKIGLRAVLPDTINDSGIRFSDPKGTSP